MRVSYNDCWLLDNRWLQATNCISTDYDMTWLGKWAELGPLGVPVGCRASKTASETYSRAGHYK